MAGQWMIYGANGYTGELTAREAVKRGQKPVLAGRNEQAIVKLAGELGLDYRVFALDDIEVIKENLDGIDLVALLAGPFIYTHLNMVKACIASKTHYMDITGEYPVFESIHRRSQEAKSAGVSLIPGVGFDVVPTDCLAAQLKEQLPDANELELAISSVDGGKNSISRGTLKTMIEGLGVGSMIRQNGRLTPVPYTWRTPTLDLPQGKRDAITLPWGDISTAFYSTGIPNIVVYMTSKSLPFKVMDIIRPVFKVGLVRKGLQGLVQKYVYGPNEHERSSAKSIVWGRVKNAEGKTVTGILETAEGYSLTADSVIRAAEKVLKGDVPAGALTPSLAFGSKYVFELDNTQGHEFQKNFE